MNKRVGGRYLIYSVFEMKNTIKKISMNNKALLTESWHFYSSYDLNSRTENEHFVPCSSGRETYNYNSYTDEDSRKPGGKFIEKHIDVSYYKLLFLIKPKKCSLLAISSWHKRCVMKRHTCHKLLLLLWEIAAIYLFRNFLNK